MKKNYENIDVRENSLAIVGYDDGGAGQISSWIESQNNYYVSCFVNPAESFVTVNIEAELKKREISRFNFPANDMFKEKPLISSVQWIDIIKKIGIKKVLITLAENDCRSYWIIKAKQAGLSMINCVHETAYITDALSLIGENIIIYPKAYIGYYAEIHTGVIINTGAQVDHHNVIKFCGRLDPGVLMAGHVIVDECSTLHTGAVIKNKIKIGKSSVVGAGSVIIKDVPENSLVVGVPGKVIKKL